MMEPKHPPDQLRELPPETRKFLAGLRPHELENLREVVTLPIDELRAGLKLAHDVKTVGKFGYWLIVTAVSVFVGTVVFYEYVLKAIGHLKGGGQ
jgi:hypothetical protein